MNRKFARKVVLALVAAGALAGGGLGAQRVSAAGTNSAEVILMYHDFYGPSSIWINKSTDGGATFRSELAGGGLGAQRVSAAGTNSAEVILMYHDFYGPSSIWINKSTDGGATF